MFYFIVFLVGTLFFGKFRSKNCTVRAGLICQELAAETAFFAGFHARKRGLFQGGSAIFLAFSRLFWAGVIWPEIPGEKVEETWGKLFGLQLWKKRAFFGCRQNGDEEKSTSSKKS